MASAGMRGGMAHGFEECDQRTCGAGEGAAWQKRLGRDRFYWSRSPREVLEQDGRQLE